MGELLGVEGVALVGVEDCYLGGLFMWAVYLFFLFHKKHAWPGN